MDFPEAFPPTNEYVLKTYSPFSNSIASWVLSNSFTLERFLKSKEKSRYVKNILYPSLKLLEMKKITEDTSDNKSWKDDGLTNLHEYK